MYWANLLHIYQPPVQNKKIVDLIANECYYKIIEVLDANPDAKLTLNINASLSELFEKYNHSDILEGLYELCRRGNIELTTSGAYHPILPLLPYEMQIEQIKLNNEMNHKLIGNCFKPKGIFPPEMCYSKELAKAAIREGCKWLIMDEVGIPDFVKPKPVYRLKDTQLYIVFRSRALSNALNSVDIEEPKDFILMLPEINSEFAIVTATDGEIYGHHKKKFYKFLDRIFKLKGVQTITITELIKLQSKSIETIEPKLSSWASTEDELNCGIPYSRWFNRGNELHLAQWLLTYRTINIAKDCKNKYAQIANKVPFSCQYYWANPYLLWSPEMIEKGLKLHLKCLGILKQENKIEKDELKYLLKIAEYIRTRIRFYELKKSLQLKPCSSPI
ncbi:MAG: hypothetical protein AB1779_01540 [Candidatus Thermoplasmatota archaeon]